MDTQNAYNLDEFDNDFEGDLGDFDQVSVTQDFSALETETISEAQEELIKQPLNELPQKDTDDDFFDDLPEEQPLPAEPPEEKSHKGIKILLIIISILFLLGIATGMFFLGKGKKDPVVANSTNSGNVVIDTRSNTEKEAVKDPLADRSVHFSGIEDADVGPHTVVYLENLPENEDFYMTYKITDIDTGEVYEETDLIPSGEHVTWRVGEKLTKPGVYHLSFHEVPYWQDENGNWITLTSGTNEVVFTVH